MAPPPTETKRLTGFLLKIPKETRLTLSSFQIFLFWWEKSREFCRFLSPLLPYKSPQSFLSHENNLNLIFFFFQSALSLVKEVSPFIRWSLIRFMKMMGAKPFITLKASDFFWGYEDRFAAFATNLLSFRYNLPFKKFGILSAVSTSEFVVITPMIIPDSFGQTSDLFNE